jgi:Aspartyl/Asparaginyl beta-hydroxylase
MQCPDRLRLPFRFAPDRLMRDMQGLASSQWIRHFVKQNYEGDWSVIPLRGPADARHPVRMIYADPTCDAFADTPMLQGCPYFRAVMDTFRCPLRNVRLMRLAAGSVIKEHSDPDLSFEDGKVRLHVPVVTNDRVAFHLNNSRVDMEAGSTWYLRLSDPHHVTNGGDSDRIHLVIDADVNDWIAAVFEGAMRALERGTAAPLAPPLPIGERSARSAG